MMKYKVNKVTIIKSGIIIDITQKKPTGIKFWFFNVYKTKRFITFRMFKNISLNPNISYTDWLVIDKTSLKRKEPIIKPKHVIKNPKLIEVLNKVLLKTKSIKKWKKDM